MISARLGSVVVVKDAARAKKARVTRRAGQRREQTVAELWVTKENLQARKSKTKKREEHQDYGCWRVRGEVACQSKTI